MYIQMLLAIAKDALEGQDGNNNAVEWQFIGFFADDLYHDWELTTRFAEISDLEQALKMLREIKQHRDENVQVYPERLLSLANEAFNNQPSCIHAPDWTLVGHFTDSLYFDYLQFKMLHERPQTLQDVVCICIKEQNLCKLFCTRTWHDYGRQRLDLRNTDEPMEIDQLRPTRKCQLCLSRVIRPTFVVSKEAD